MFKRKGKNMNEEILEQANQRLNQVQLDIDEIRMMHESVEIDIATNIKYIEQQLERDCITQREYDFFMNQLEYVKETSKREEETYLDYEQELKQTRDRIEEEIEKLEKSNQEKAEETDVDTKGRE